MPRKAGVVTINLNAGTAQFFAEMDKAHAKLHQFGEAGVSEARATSAAMKTLEGNFLNNTRAADKFLESVLGLGPVMRAAFPVIGGIAFAGMLTEITKKAYEFYKSMAEGPERIKGAFRELNAPLRLTNDELALANARLANDLAQLEGKPKNMLAVALHEAVVEADKLADSLDKSLADLNKMLDKKGVPWYGGLLGQAGTGYLKEEFGGDTGTGFPERIEAIRKEGDENLRLAVTAKDLGAADEARLETTRKLLVAYYAELRKVDEWERQAKDRAKDSTVTGVGLAGVSATVRGTDERANLESLAGIRDRLQREIAEIDQRANAGAMGEKKTLGEGAAEAEKPAQVFANELAKLQAHLAGARRELAAVGQDHAFQVQAKAAAEADEVMARLVARFKDMKAGAPPTKEMEGAIRSVIGATEGTEDQTAWAQKIDATVKKLRDETHEQELLTAAVGKGYAAIRDASIEAAVMKSMGPERYDKDSADAARIRAAASAEYDAKHRAAQAEVLLNLREQIGLERSLAVAQAAGAAAVREAELQAKAARMELAGATKANIDAEKELAAAKHATAIAADIAKIDEQTAATERLTAAIGKGAVAVRAAMLANRLAEIEREGDIPVPGVVGIGQRGLAAIGQDSAAHAQQVAEAAARADRVQAIDDEIGKLEEAKATRGDTLGIEMQLRDIQQQRIKALAEESVSLGGARDGMRAFFIEMQERAQTSASIIYEALNSALDKTSENLMKLMTGQGKKSDWGKELKGVGDQMAESSIKSLMQKGLGTLGVSGKADGSSAGNALWVRMAGATPALAMPGGGSMPAGGAQGGSFWSSLLKPFGIPGGGDGSSSLGDTNTLDFGGWMAGGGEVDPGHVYMVGEKGPEPFVPSSRGRVIPNEALGGSITLHTHVDARGADLGMANRIHRAIDDAHRNAVATAIQATHERARRVPRHR